MFSLIAKDFKLLFQGSSKNKMSKILGLLFTIVVGVLFIIIETYLFNAIFTKLKVIQKATSSYFSVFLFVISTLLTVFAVMTAKKLFFNEADNTKLQSLPISNGKIVMAKLFFLFLTMYFMNLVFNLPLFITFGRIYHKMTIFYFNAVFYPLFLFFFQAGVALIFVYPVKLLLDFLKKHIFIQLGVVLVFAFGLTFLYSRALNVFINLVAENDIDSLFTVRSITAIEKAARFMVPINFLEDVFVNNSGRALFPSIAISFGTFAIGVTLVIYFYNKFLQQVFSTPKKKNENELCLKMVSPKKALMKKELILLFRDSNYLFSFIGLLAVEPFLSYLIIKSFNTIFTNGAISYYLLAVPNIISFMDVLVMMLISTIIFQGANNYITNENKNVRLMKSIPVSPYSQLFIKVAIPFLMSIAFLFISYLVLLVTRTISVLTALYALVTNVILLFALTIISLFEELNIKRNQEKNSLLSSVYTYAVPIVYFLFALLMCYLKINYNIIFVVGIVIVMASLIPFVINFKSRVNEKFLSLEVSN